MPTANRKLRVFLCHASHDKAAVREIYQRLLSERWIDPWLDEEKLLPGQDWSFEIEKAVESSDAVIVFLSHNSLNKEGFVQRELRYVLDITDQKPEGTIFIIPVRLDNDSVAPRRLRSYQWVDLFEKNSYQKILHALEVRNKSIGVLEQETVQYDLDVVNDLLLKLSDKQLRSLVYEEFPNLLERINWGGYMFKTVSEIILFAQKENKISLVVEWVSKNIPNVYSKYSSRLELISSIKDDGDIVVSGSGNIINFQRVEKSRFRNPYVTGNPIQPTNSRVFWGRLDIADSIIHEIKRSRQKPSFLLYGRRRMGKTSTLLNLRRLIRDIKTIDVLISGQNSKFHNDVDFCFHMTEKIIKTTKESLLLSDNFIQHKKYSDYNYFSNKSPSLVLSVFFDEYHEFLEKNDLYCLLMLDEYEEFGNLSRELLLQLRDTLQHMPRFIFIFSGVSHMNELPSPFWSEIFINVRTLKITFLQHDDGYKLLTEPAPELAYQSSKVIEKILDITGGQPFLLQAIAAELVNEVNLSNKLAISNKELEIAVRRVFGSWQNYFDGYIWKKECSTDIHKKIVSQIARDKKVRRTAFQRYTAQINDLVEKDILKIQNEYLQLTMPIIGMWLEQVNYRR
jgi:hypothetical protein